MKIYWNYKEVIWELLQIIPTHKTRYGNYEFWGERIETVKHVMNIIINVMTTTESDFKPIKHLKKTNSLASCKDFTFAVNNSCSVCWCV